MMTNSREIAPCGSLASCADNVQLVRDKELAEKLARILQQVDEAKIANRSKLSDPTFPVKQ